MIEHKVFERIFLILLITILVGFAFMKFNSLNDPFEGEGLIDIGGYSLFIKSEGSRTPTVVFETGTGGTLNYWNLVTAEIQKHARTVTYDRAGLGKSEKSPYNRTSEQKAIELHSLLNNAKIKSPYILVGNEFGAHNIRIFAAKYPEEVAGIILVDPRSENIRELLMVYYPNELKEQFEREMKFQYERSSNKMLDGSYEEFLNDYEQVKAHRDSIKDIPLTAIISGTLSFEPMIKTIVEDQKQLAAISSKSKVVEVTNSIAYTAYRETNTIIQEVLEMINKVKEKK